MGMPSFYKWLVGKYPAIVSPAMEHDDDATRSNDGIYHNFYLDMNCVIHPCFHPEDDQVCPPMTLDEVFHSMFDYIDRLFRIVRPTSLLYLAVDGVAPRAKMNQQRARRFKNAKDAKDAEIEENLLRDKFRAEGKEVLPREEASPSSEVSDPNVITPGTEFMEKLSEALKYYVRARLSTDPGWKDIKVIISDANVPGEGEHKIMAFIRAQRSREGYDPNTRHCLYGLDADLIMLALASHEVHFSILREDVPLRNQQLNCVPIPEKFSSTTHEPVKLKYQFLNVWVLREYLELEMNIPNPVLKTDIERLIDDFVFILLLTGNDFVPQIPSLSIHEGAVDLLIEVYKTSFNKMGGYIVDTDKVKHKHAAYLKLSRLEKFFHELSLYEEKIFVKRYDLRESYQRKIQRQARESAWNERNSENLEEYLDDPVLMAMSFQTQERNSACSTEQTDITMNTLELRRNLKDVLRNKQDLIKSGACKRDKIRLGLPGWKARFYKEKFGAETSEEIGKLQNDMVHEMRRNTFRQEKIFMKKSNALAKNEVFAQTSGSLQKFPIDPATSEMGGFLSSDDDDCLGNVFILSAMENLQDVENGDAMSAMFFNPEKVNPATRLLHNVQVPDKTVTEADISARPLWHTYPGTRPAVYCPHQHGCRPENLWKPRSPAPPLEDVIKAAGTGRTGLGRGNAPAAETQLPWSNRYGRGRGGATVGHTMPRQWGGVYGRGAVDNMPRVQAGGSSSRFDSGGGSSSYSLRPAWRQPGPWGRDGRDGGGLA
ncbi:hypothetical protein GUJ93_ZPchr0011g28753 [Zizania palustris]|uniref:Uncharacterized protein n=1 Tax=Zizania palustris TaxID=103762 RepID=A0A8J6BP25_ZIZPA|nr:hypothetical protein GUJ93_ZPchr0011g28753 [Zizania palustris]